jgi:two-component system cell cycle response regulator CpdR
VAAVNELPGCREVFARPHAARCESVPIDERQGLSVFVVDDEELITRSLAQILRNEGFEVTPFNNPLKALSRLESGAPDLLISDVMMPELNGIELARETRKALPDCSILLFSGAADDLMREAGHAGVGFRMLSKPLHPDRLLEEIGSALGAHRPAC